MSINYSQPLSLAYQRMKKALFQPFNISKWFRVGFTAWLAGLTDCQGSGGNGSNNANSGDWDSFFNFPETASTWLMDHPFWSNLIIIGIVLLIILITVIIWISSRGKFMFLHNVIHDKQEISKPWLEYKKEGNSLFLFNLFFSWAALAVFIFIAIHSFLEAKELYLGDYTSVAIFGAVAKLVLLFILFLITFGYISLFINDFVVPIMYKQRIGILKAWAKFIHLFARKFVYFLLYGLFVFVLGIAVVFGVLFLALITCCIGLLFIAIPYIGSVVLLPISYTFRGLSIEFLAQFGQEFNVLEDDVLPILEEKEA